MPLNSWTDGKRKLDQMVSVAKHCESKTFERSYGITILRVEIIEDEPAFFCAGRGEIDLIDAAKVVQTWDTPSRNVL